MATYAAATLRWFDTHLLMAVLDRRVEEVFLLLQQLQTFPFIQTHARGHAMLPGLRRTFRRHLAKTDPGLLRLLSSRAVDAFATSDDLEVRVEYLTHLLFAAPERFVPSFRLSGIGTAQLSGDLFTGLQDLAVEASAMADAGMLGVSGPAYAYFMAGLRHEAGGQRERSRKVFEQTTTHPGVDSWLEEASRERLAARISLERSVAIVIGIGDYGFGIEPRPGVRREAEGVAELLTDSYHHELLTLYGANATAANILGLLENVVPRRLAPGDRLIFYFAGRGATTYGDRPTSYLVPYDADPSDEATFIPLRALLEVLSVLPANHVLVVLDGGFPGPVLDKGLTDPEVGRVFSQQARLLRRRRSFQVIASHQPNTSPGRISQADLSVTFGEAIRRGIGGEASLDRFGVPRTGGLITGASLARYAQRLTTGGGPSVSFWSFDGHEGGEYLFQLPGYEALPPAPPLVANRCPYLGARPYSAVDAAGFFGRRDAVDRLERRVETALLTVLVGPGNSGKTSLVAAGLIPRLQAAPTQTVSTLGVATLGGSPWEDLAAGLGGEPPDAGTVRGQREAFVRAMEAALVDVRGPCLFVVDQFERLFQHAERETRVGVLDALAQCLTRFKDKLRILVVIDVAYEHHAWECPLMPWWSSGRIPIPALERRDVAEIIEAPAAANGVAFEPPDFVGRLTDEVLQIPSGLSLLSCALQEMYLELVARTHGEEGHDATLEWTITEHDYRAIGGLYGAVCRRAERAFDRLDRGMSVVARRTLVRLVTMAGHTAIRRCVPVAQLLPEDAHEAQRTVRILDIFEAAGVLTRVETSGSVGFELAHDSLLTSWPRLGRWLQEDERSILLREELGQTAIAWNQKRRRGLLWHADARIEQIRIAVEGDPHWCNATEAEFVRASLREAGTRVRRGQILVGLGALALVATLVAVAVAATQMQRATEAGDQIVGLKASLASQMRISDEQAREVVQLEQRWVSGQLILRAHDAREGGDPLLAGLLVRQAAAFRDAGPPEVDDPLRTSAVAVLDTPWLGQWLPDATAAGFTPDGRVVTARGTRVTVHAATGAGVDFDHDTGVTQLLIRGDKLITGTHDGSVYLWSLANPARPPEVLAGHEAKITALHLGRRDERLVTGDDKGQVLLWTLGGSDRAPMRRDADAAITSVALSPDRVLVTATTSAGELKVWDLSAGGRLRRTMPTTSTVSMDDFSRDSSTFVTTDGTATIKVWDAYSSSLGLKKTIPLAHPATVVRFIDGKTLVIGYANGNVELADGQRGARRSVAQGAAVRDLFVGRDGSELVVVREGGAIELVHIASGKSEVVGGGSEWTTVAVGDDARRFAAVADGRVQHIVRRASRVPAEWTEVLDALCSQAGRTLTQAEWDAHVSDRLPFAPACLPEL